VQGPRYTSYPAANHFGPVKAGDVRAHWAGLRERGEVDEVGLYLHMPFCASRCAFCGCHTTGAPDDATVAGYLADLEAELAMVAEIAPSNRVRTVAWGGGTAHFPSAPRLSRLIDAMWRRFDPAGGAEISIEADPRTLTEDRIDALRSGGFNRFSLGVQDLEDAVVSRLRPGQTEAVVTRTVDLLRARGIDALNFDLIYGLPGQTAETARATARKVCALAPGRIALYSYAHVPWFHGHQRRLDELGLPSPSQKAAVFDEMAEAFVGAGYARLGMDHFAHPLDSLHRAAETGTMRRSFMGYTTGGNLPTLGFGASAISDVRGLYSQNHKDLNAYAGALRGGELAAARGHLLDAEDLLRRDLIERLLCTFEIDWRALDARHGTDVAGHLGDRIRALEGMASDGLLRVSPDRVTLTDLGRFFVRNVAMIFDGYIDRDGARSVYSRTL